MSADGSHHGSRDEALDSSAALAVSAELLTWARQVSRAAADSTRAPGGTSDADMRSHSHVDQTVTSSSASAAAIDPYAFDINSYNGSSAGADANATSSSLEHDPFAFNMDAFGMSAAAETQQWNGESDTQLQQGPKSTPSTDPFAFNMDAFAGAGHSLQPQTEDDAASPDPYAAERSDATSSQEQGNSAAKAQSSSADPFAFDMGAFGMAASSEPQPERETSSGNKPSAAGTDTGDTSPGASPDGAAEAPAADPCAFDMGAFSMGGAALPDLAAGGADRDPFAADRGTSDDRSQSAKAVANTADPFAFNAGACGMAEISHPDPAADSAGTDPFASDRSSTAQELRDGSDIVTGTLNAANFGTSATSAATSAQSESLAASGEGRKADLGRIAPDQAPGRVQTDRALRSSQLEASTSYSGSLTSGVKSGVAQQQRSPPAKWQAALAKPVQESFEPLSAAELQDLHRLLCSAAGMGESSIKQGEILLLLDYVKGRQGDFLLLSECRSAFTVATALRTLQCFSSNHIRRLCPDACMRCTCSELTSHKLSPIERICSLQR